MHAVDYPINSIMDHDGRLGGRENLHIEVDHNTNIMLCSYICSTSFIENSLLDNTA